QRAPLRELAELADGDAEAQSLERERDAEDAVAPEAVAHLDAWADEVVDPVEDREGAADAEEEERDDEGPEVALARSPEGEALVGGARREAHADEEEGLVARVGE